MSRRYASPIISPSAYERSARRVSQEDLRVRTIAGLKEQRAALIAAKVSPNRLPDVHDRMSPADLVTAQEHLNATSKAHGIAVTEPVFKGQTGLTTGGLTTGGVSTGATKSKPAPPAPRLSPTAVAAAKQNIVTQNLAGTISDDEAQQQSAALDASQTGAPVAAVARGPMARPFATGLNSGGTVIDPNITAATFDGMRTTETPAGVAKVYDPRDDQGIIQAPAQPGADRSVYVPQKYGGGIASVNYGPARTSPTNRIFDETGDVTANYTAPAAPPLPEAATAPPPQAPNPGVSAPSFDLSQNEDKQSEDSDMLDKFSENRFDNEFKKGLMYAGRFS